MKVIITGASGFLGQVLCKKLTQLNYEVIALSSKDADLTNQNSLLRFNDIKFDQIFHLAAWTQAGDFCLYHPGEQWLMNQQINTTILTWWKVFQPQAKLISFGTSCSYPEIGELIESNYLIGEPIKDLYVYAMTKRMLFIGQQALHKQFGLNYLTVVPSTVYGPGYHTEGKQLHFIFDLIRKILEFKHSQKEVVLWGDGNQRRELVFVNDFIEEMLELDKKINNDLVNIGAGQDYSIKEFAEMICSIAGVDPSLIKYDTTRYVGAKSKTLSNKKLDELLPHKKRTSLRDGLQVTVEWMEKELFN
jgi:GDP-L-fucose synthase